MYLDEILPSLEEGMDSYATTASGSIPDPVRALPLPAPGHEEPRLGTWRSSTGWRGGKAEAPAAVPEDLLTAVTLIGDEESIRDQVSEFHTAGVRTFLLNPLADDPADRVDHVRRLAGIVAETTF